MRFLFFFLLLAAGLRAQIDSAITIPLLGFNVSGQLPSGDLVQRFGPNLKIGASFLVKTKRSWVFGLEGNYLFGGNVKEDVLAQLKTPEGFVVDNEGYPADIRVTQRGLILNAMFGRLLQLGSSNPNSGLIVAIGAGYMQHKVNLYDAQQKIAAVKGDLRHGYDRLTAGLCITEFIGYLFISENRFLNFYFGIESTQGFTKSLRKLNYDTGQRDEKKRMDVLSGLRLGWILPLYKKRPNEYYYN